MIKNNLIKDFLVFFLIFLLDRISKIYVVYLEKINLNSEIFSSKFLNIYLIWNEGIAFGLFSFSNEFTYNLFTALIVLINLIVSK